VRIHHPLIIPALHHPVLDVFAKDVVSAQPVAGSSKKIGSADVSG
jgi:hypothetical protein